MVNYIWVGMMVTGFIVAIFSGNVDKVNAAVFKSAQEAVTISLGMISILVFWLGLMKIAEKGGLLEFLALLFRPLVKRLFPDVPEGHPALGYILSNMVANLFGLGNAATPMGIKAMEQLKLLNGGKNEASRSMITLLAINTSSITLIPTTIIAIRMNYGSQNPTDIVGTTLMATAVSTVFALSIDRFFYYRSVRKGKK
ncbi:nucleoside recognition domain-containing protein [Fictibacillus enclensis]|uniref:Spore maturation protein n=1 Tax=Fictibacillus enclensis TaxID=1017270 RepID=A0A0V8JF89_9BACL|nr:nucleoside recognition domain-containing protein [Fictibacillus enclensis]KSU85626.1 spore maturation protein [Fictibacillus enclensis]MDM5199568.1 nucleoside recognition domain-containing protein [Fictibacillus enclensis]MDM5338806.1 nucleoside recognition domain-containing protein [Fictibacillus enclensis]WHY70302.1 nucleoside recognition domain-containing protein [Fictibacillus enclensis]SCB99926.1 spore maturation protein A [Fictibacillus enclensis]